jgi:hypothetical protein
MLDTINMKDTDTKAQDWVKLTVDQIFQFTNIKRDFERAMYDSWQAGYVAAWRELNAIKEAIIKAENGV